MENLKELNLEALTLEASKEIGGGAVPSENTSFGNDVGYYLGWFLSAMGKGASATYG